MIETPIRVPGVGELIDGKYRVLREIGVGGMGVVLEAVDETLDREVAVKLVGPGFAGFDALQERILEEARAMATVRHENVVRVYSCGEHRGAPYFVMELVEGRDLGHWLRRYLHGNPPSIDEALGIIDQICRGLGAVHEAGIIHGDVKPGNVLLGPAFRVAVTDFGLFRAMGGTADDGDVVGTPAYIAPEIVRGTAKVASPRSDIYSVGVLAFQMLTGELPIPIRTHDEMFAAHREGTAPRVASELRDDLPPSFDSPLAMAIRPEPADRPESMEVFRRALLSARQGIAQSGSMRIVVADDDPDFLALISETLGFAFPGSAIECVTDGTQALTSLDSRRADLAVVDLDMPGMNGLELTAAVRAKPGLRDLPILVVTARGGAPDWQLLKAMGAAGFLLKPLDAYALITMARRALGVSARPS